MSTYVDKPISLIEKKKQQWAKEREELAGLGAPWRSAAPKEFQSFDQPFQRSSRYVSKFAMANNPEIFRNRDPSNVRRSSLPPLYKNQYNSIDIVRDGETSGYGSDNPTGQTTIIQQTSCNQSGYESSSSYKDDRARWKEKSQFWSGKENEPPNWVKRGLQTDEEILVSNTSPAESPQNDDLFEGDRPYTGQSSLNRVTYVRGQNIPMDSKELAERERRRQVALSYQEAVRQQLEERERKRREEKERRIKEEIEEEVRIEREQEVERQRKEEELRQIREKQMREEKRKAILQEALQVAEEEAKQEKIKMKMMKQNKEDDNNDVECDKKMNNSSVTSPRPETIINNNLEVKGTSKSLLNIPKIENPNANQQSFSAPNNVPNIQYAILVQSNSVPIATPLERTENRVLTPTQYRNGKNRTVSVCDSSTQTDSNDFLRTDVATATSLIDDRNRSSGKNKERRTSSEDRPKWGANCPPTRYMKQSEKDLRRKTRQKVRDYKNSSDESQIGSPRASYRKRAMWRKNDRFFARNIRMYQTEIVPLESDKERIYYCCCTRCNCSSTQIEHTSPMIRADRSGSEENANLILDKLTTLHNNLLIKQEQWQHSPRTPNLSSANTRNNENN